MQTSDGPSKLLSFRANSALQRRLRFAAAERGISVSELIREAAEGTADAAIRASVAPPLAPVPAPPPAPASLNVHGDGADAPADTDTDNPQELQ